ncbi:MULTISPECIES: hypothetical protein [Rhodococcus]|uniref:Uncharacterized protein n=1 Tax=Rhodococcus opacus RKJ300 = JCM 13270 TaxID=1165867 RepID=I0WNT2_RHOOP|nr:MULTISPECIES: hypothetical protein [Rhodococcus]EID78048.1 hypothetical protein W59_20793 [Rhodococcus opacus RKJ300 = JCM 13270]QQZ19562.1 hypothetical protein GO592_43665 [Rhodococcus sp. 21391]
MTTEQLVRNTIIAVALSDPFDCVEVDVPVVEVEGEHCRDNVSGRLAGDIGGDFDDWVLAATRSGLFTPREIEALARSWHADPRTLFGALLTYADDMTRKRYEIAWDSLDEADSREYA